MNTVLYRKYRPQEFKEVVGQDHVVNVLVTAIKAGNISHAYLFAGGRGTGKTSIARILAKEIGTSPDDLYEIDAASNRGIDDIRELREGVNTLPFNSKYKVYIIDEVHMLTKEAFNALLKTLEEPPKHVVFVLATTELDKLPETIVSRCQTFQFKKPTIALLREMVLDVSTKEGFKLDPASAELISLLGDGSFRDTHGILQKVLSSSVDKKITHDEVEMVTGAPRKQLVMQFLGALSNKDLAGTLSLIQQASKDNIDIKTFLKLILHKIRTVLLIRYAPELAKGFEEEVGEDEFKVLKSLADAKESFINSQCVLELIEAQEKTKFADISVLPLELALIKLLSKG